MSMPHTRNSKRRASRLSDPQPTSAGGYARRTLPILKATSGRSTSPLNRKQRGKRSPSGRSLAIAAWLSRRPKPCRFFFTAFPPRLFWQPIFYPVLNEAYAIQIARDWNARDGNSGYVTRFQVRTDFLRRYEVHQVGSALYQEYWIPAEELEEFNRNIVGKIEVIAEFHS